MRKLFIASALLLLSGCATVGQIDYCKGAELRRTAYNTAITAIDAYTVSGRPVPAEVLLGKQAALIALETLNRNCPPKNDPG